MLTSTQTCYVLIDYMNKEVLNSLPSVFRLSSQLSPKKFSVDGQALYVGSLIKADHFWSTCPCLYLPMVHIHPYYYFRREQLPLWVTSRDQMQTCTARSGSRCKFEKVSRINVTSDCQTSTINLKSSRVGSVVERKQDVKGSKVRLAEKAKQ